MSKCFDMPKSLKIEELLKQFVNLCLKQIIYYMNSNDCSTKIIVQIYPYLILVWKLVALLLYTNFSTFDANPFCKLE